ncbi:MAG: Phosphoenolpyruvate carboxylase, partial [Parcubacteria group bacterium GW2011_GWA2_47_9]
FYGVGTALKKYEDSGEFEKLKQFYQNSDFFKTLLVATFIGVVLVRKLPVCFFYFILGSVMRNAQNFIIVFHCLFLLAEYRAVCCGDFYSPLFCFSLYSPFAAFLPPSSFPPWLAGADLYISEPAF